jgi:hypothetical protein
MPVTEPHLEQLRRGSITAATAAVAILLLLLGKAGCGDAWQ